MAKKKKYSVQLFGTLPCSAKIEVEAENEDDAKQIALENCEHADWDGADYNTPEGATVEAGEVQEIVPREKKNR